ncbi:MAG: NUDIX domain-containing protein [Chloroflexi bacterium]|nr:NUDIX domain-containing protein [Chloroflexota bacterium]
MNRRVRYQATIIKDDNVLMLKVRDHALSGNIFWVIPGGGREPDESEEECVKREVLEETHLHVEIERLVHQTDVSDDMYSLEKTYACRKLAGST